MRIRPILPCQSIKDQVSFYESLGFQTIQIYTRPHPYAVIRYESLELHFYSNKKLLPQENPQMCYIEVDDVNQLYEAFTSGLKQATGRIPRSGIPRISKLKDLKEDRRFILTDVGGNTFYIGTAHADHSDRVYFRTLHSEELANHFEILYDLIYSKEDAHSAYNMLEKFFSAEKIHAINIEDLDLAKILLVTLEIHWQRDHAVNPEVDGQLQRLFNVYNTEDPDWYKILQQYDSILSS